ncbi:hypothetical protein C2S51_035423 [Perilla frutescens var. frutescens]|nr:hypothetical protein C2S51_035423 [Perilla frutescens var. frutescens]
MHAGTTYLCPLNFFPFTVGCEFPSQNQKQINGHKLVTTDHLWQGKVYRSRGPTFVSSFRRHKKVEFVVAAE